MAEELPKRRIRPVPRDPETTVPEPTSAGGPEASAEGEVLATEQPGHYALKRELARGGQSIVYVALDRRMGRDVAYKQLLPGGPRDSGQELFVGHVAAHAPIERH